MKKRSKLGLKFPALKKDILPPLVISVKAPSQKKKKAEAKQKKILPQKQHKLLLAKEEYRSMLEYFQKKYPKSFPKKPRPLAISIHKTIRSLPETPYSGHKIWRFLRIYTGSKLYRKNLIKGTARIDLAGNITSKITAKEVKFIKEKKNQKK